MRVLVTGGAGFIGSHIVEHFQGKAQVVVLDNFRTGKRENLHGFEYELIEDSILNRDAVAKAMKGVDYVFHLAAMISVPESMMDPIQCIEINTRGLLIVLEEAARASVKKLVFSSSAAIYGDDPEIPKVETMTPRPKSPYAITKLDGEYYCQMFASNRNLNTVALRYFNVFGPRQDPKSAYAAAVPIFIYRACNNEDITVFGDGEQTRDFIFVKDIVAANVFAAMNESTKGVYNVAYGQKITINDLATEIIRLLDSRSKILHGPERLGDVKHSLASIQSITEAGFRPTSQFDKGLEATIAYFQGS